jgi:hypothetical protein
MTNTQTELPVEQCDRDAADTWRREWYGCRGEHTALVHAFARHRLTAPNLAAENARLREALEPFARAEGISTGFDGERIYAILHYPVDAKATICLAALSDARTALDRVEP